MGLNDEKVKEIIGKEAWDILFQSVTRGELEALKMREVVQKLHPAVGGAHLRRTGPPQRRESDWTEMREILNDWYQQGAHRYALFLCSLNVNLVGQLTNQQELFNLDKESALEKLVNIFESDALMLRGLGGQIKKLITNQGNGLVCMKNNILTKFVLVCMKSPPLHSQRQEPNPCQQQG